jgi:hypothetical protein
MFNDEVQKPRILLRFGPDQKPHFYKQKSSAFRVDDGEYMSEWDGKGRVFIDFDIFREYRLSSRIPEQGDTFELLGFQFLCIDREFVFIVAMQDDLAANHYFLFHLLHYQELGVWYRMKIRTAPYEHRRCMEAWA